MNKPDWDIVKTPDGDCFLEHKNCRNKKGYVVFLDEDGNWRCNGRNQIAPENIKMIATLCYCYPMPETASVYKALKEKKNK